MSATDDGCATLYDRRRLRIVPILHGHIEFALDVRRQFFEFRPTVVAVEHPVTLRTAIEKGVARLPYLSVVYYQESDGTAAYTLIEPTDGLIEAVRLALEHDVPRAFVDRDTEGYPQQWNLYPDPYAAARLGPTAFALAYQTVRGAEPAGPEDTLREQTMAHHLADLLQRYARVMFVCGLEHAGRVEQWLSTPPPRPLGRVKRDGVALWQLAEISSRELLSEPPFAAAAYEQWRRQHPALPDRPGPPWVPEALDRLVMQQELVELARAALWKNAGERLGPDELQVMFQFGRNYALLEGRLVPDFYEMIIAARGASGDNFAYEVWDAGATYPFQDPAATLPTLALSWEDLLRKGRKIRFRRRLPQQRRRLVRVPVRPRPQEQRPGEWKEHWSGEHIVSYPPEDVVIEGYGRRLQNKALAVLNEQGQRVCPLTVSLLDGVDIRETVRHWAEKRLYVREDRPARGRIGSVVVIFDEDLATGRSVGAGPRYPWCITWLGEHEQESDMAFYATPAGQQLVGPGISRCEYGGFMLTYPPLRVFDIWRDAVFDNARTKAERLLLAAIDYSQQRYIAYVAARPPRSRMHTVAERYGRKILYLPIGTLSPPVLQKIRVFHVLDGMPVRYFAKAFIR